MKKNVFEQSIIYLVAVSFMMLCIPVSFADIDPVPLTGNPAHVNAQGSYVPVITEGPLLDNFNSPSGFNMWGGSYLTFATQIGGEVLTTSYDTVNRRGTSGYGYKIHYSVPGNASYAGVAITLTPSEGPKNLTAYKYLSFWVKGSTNNIPLKLEFQNTSTNIQRDNALLYISDYLDGGITTSWRQVQIPLTAFANLNRQDNVDGIVFVFEHDYAVNSSYPTSGTVYVDDFTFSTSALNSVRIDHFPDNWGWMAIGGNMGSMNVHTNSFSSSIYHNYPQSLKSVYNVNNAPEWGGMFMLFGGGEDGWTAQQCNFSEYRYLKFWVRAESSSKNPKILKLELQYGASGVKEVIINNITTSWKQYTIDLNAIGVDKTKLKQMNIIYEKWRILGAGGRTYGTVYFDEMEFTK